MYPDESAQQGRGKEGRGQRRATATRDAARRCARLRGEAARRRRATTRQPTTTAAAALETTDRKDKGNHAKRPNEWRCQHGSFGTQASRSGIGRKAAALTGERDGQRAEVQQLLHGVLRHVARAGHQAPARSAHQHAPLTTGGGGKEAAGERSTRRARTSTTTLLLRAS